MNADKTLESFISTNYKKHLYTIVKRRRNNNLSADMSSDQFNLGDSQNA